MTNLTATFGATIKSRKGINWVCAECGHEYVWTAKHIWPKHGEIIRHLQCERCDCSTTGRAILAANGWIVVVDPAWLDIPLTHIDPSVGGIVDRWH